MSYRDTWSGSYVSDIPPFDDEQWKKELSISLKKTNDKLHLSFVSFLDDCNIECYLSMKRTCVCCLAEPPKTTTIGDASDLLVRYLEIHPIVGSKLPVCATCETTLRYLALKRQQITTKFNSSKCTICYQNPRQCANIPCGHFGFCKNCITQHISIATENTTTAKCPLCNQAITDILQIYIC